MSAGDKHLMMIYLLWFNWNDDLVRIRKLLDSRQIHTAALWQNITRGQRYTQTQSKGDRERERGARVSIDKWSRQQMDGNTTDPLLLALQNYESADLIELCRLYVQNIYLKHYGRTRAFLLLQMEHERYNLDAQRSIKLLLILFALTWFLQSSIYGILARTFCSLVNCLFSLTTRLRHNRNAGNVQQIA